MRFKVWFTFNEFVKYTIKYYIFNIWDLVNIVNKKYFLYKTEILLYITE